MFQSRKHHAVCDCVYTMVSDVLVESFAGTVIHFYFGADLISVISVQAFFT